MCLVETERKKKEKKKNMHMDRGCFIIGVVLFSSSEVDLRECDKWVVNDRRGRPGKTERWKEVCGVVAKANEIEKVEWMCVFFCLFSLHLLAHAQTGVGVCNWSVLVRLSRSHLHSGFYFSH